MLRQRKKDRVRIAKQNPCTSSLATSASGSVDNITHVVSNF